MQYFAVQRCSDPETHAFAAPRTIAANSVLEAAELVIGEKLALFGDRQNLAARVIRLNDNYTSATTMVFFVTKDEPTSNRGRSV
ncbi:MAG: hypothetical protein ACTHNL_13785 [Devosia sp.]